MLVFLFEDMIKFSYFCDFLFSRQNDF